jgi:transcriptional regulator with XRE-family HTH domain
VAKAAGRGRGIEVIPERIRLARREAGLSLAQLAAGAVTPVAIHLIETGKSRPSPATLAHIAGRTGKTMRYFAEVEPGMVTGAVADSAKRARRSMQEGSWALGLLLRHPLLTRTEREALRSVMGTMRWSAALLETLDTELRVRESP